MTYKEAVDLFETVKNSKKNIKEDKDYKDYIKNNQKKEPFTNDVYRFATGPKLDNIECGIRSLGEKNKLQPLKKEIEKLCAPTTS